MFRLRSRTCPRSAVGERLAGCAVGSTVRLGGLDSVGASQRRRLAEFGLRPGRWVTVLARTAGGGRLVGLGTSRIALDAETVRLLAITA